MTSQNGTNLTAKYKRKYMTQVHHMCE